MKPNGNNAPLLGQDESSPSHARRMALRDANQVSIQVLDTNPIDRYYEMSLKLLSAFQVAVDERRLDQAYVYGVRFATFSLDALPRHRQYRQPKFQKLRARNLKQVDVVIKMTEVVTQRMDAEEMMKLKRLRQQKEDEERLRKEEEERERIRRVDEERRRQEEEADKAERQRRENTKLSIEKSAMAKLEALGKSMKFEQATTTNKERESKIHGQPDECANDRTAHSTVASNSKSSSTKETQRNTKLRKNSTLTKKQRSNRQVGGMEQETVAPTMSPPTAACTDQIRSSEPQRMSKETAKTEQHVEISNPQPIQSKRKTPISQEEKTIELLRDSIAKQESRLDYIERVQIPALLREAKNHLRTQKQQLRAKHGSTSPGSKQSDSEAPGRMENNPESQQRCQEALACVAKKKRLERQVDVIKGAIFNMETQMFMLESALEDRHVQKAMKEAAEAMKELQRSADVDAEELDLTETTAGLQLPEGDLEEEDLLEELEVWLSPEGENTLRMSTGTKQDNRYQLGDAENDDDISILSLPTIPDDAPSRPTPQKETRSVRNLLRAVLG